MTGLALGKLRKTACVVLCAIFITGACASVREKEFADDFVSIRVPGSWNVEVTRGADVEAKGEVRRFPRYRVKPNDLVLIEFTLVTGTDPTSLEEEFERIFDQRVGDPNRIDVTGRAAEPFRLRVRGETLVGVRRRAIMSIDGVQRPWSFSVIATEGRSPQLLVGTACPDSHWEFTTASLERVLNTIVVRVA